MEIPVPKLLRIAPHALEHLGEYLKEEKIAKVALFWGKRVEALFGETIRNSLAYSGVSVVFEKEVTTNSIDDAFVISKEFTTSVDTILAIGGGKAIDFGKYIAFNKQLSLISVPTLISNDAFASPSSSLLVDGERRSIKTVVPRGIIIDTEVIRSSDERYIYSGIGELFSKTTALHDWRLAADTTGIKVNDFAASITLNAVDTFSYYPRKTVRSIEYIGIITNSLLMTGIAMTIAGSSRPASGAEHLISHAYDRLSGGENLHGIQVGVASYCVAFVQGTTLERVSTDMVESGFYDFVVDHPLHKSLFLEAIERATSVKENYYTVLSQEGAIAKLQAFVEYDPRMQKMVK